KLISGSSAIFPTGRPDSLFVFGQNSSYTQQRIESALVGVLDNLGRIWLSRRVFIFQHSHFNRVGGFLTVPAYHTSGHTFYVPRRFPEVCIARWWSARGIRPWAWNQAMVMASLAWQLWALRQQPLPLRARRQARHSGTPRLRRKSACARGRLHCLRRKQRNLRRIQASRRRSWVWQRA